MKTKTLGTLLSLACAATLALPTFAAAADKETRQMMADIRMLQEQTQELAVAIATVTQALQDSIKTLNQRLDQGNDTTRKGFAARRERTSSIPAAIASATSAAVAI